MIFVPLPRLVAPRPAPFFALAKVASSKPSSSGSARDRGVPAAVVALIARMLGFAPDVATRAPGAGFVASAFPRFSGGLSEAIAEHVVHMEQLCVLEIGGR